MRTYDIQRLEAANCILEYRDSGLYSEDWIRWAKKVKSFFNRLYRIAKSFIGRFLTWSDRIKLAWEVIYKLIAKYNKKLKKYDAIIINGVAVLKGNEERQTMRIRTKYGFRSSLQRKKDIQELRLNKTI